MEAHHERMLIEQKDLSEKVSKLESFIETPTFESLDPHEQHLMQIQLNAMNDYSGALQERIERAAAH